MEGMEGINRDSCQVSSGCRSLWQLTCRTRTRVVLPNASLACGSRKRTCRRFRSLERIGLRTRKKWPKIRRDVQLTRVDSFVMLLTGVDRLVRATATGRSPVRLATAVANRADTPSTQTGPSALTALLFREAIRETSGFLGSTERSAAADCQQTQAGKTPHRQRRGFRNLGRRTADSHSSTE